MGRAIPVLLLVLALAPAALAQTLHEDFSRAQDDFRVLRLSAARVLALSTQALNLTLADDPPGAMVEKDAAAALSLAMVEAARLNATSATSTRPLAPLAAAADALSGNASGLVEDWPEWQDLVRAGFATRADTLHGELLLGAMRDAVRGGFEAADEYERLGYDVGALRASLERFRASVESQSTPADLTGDPALFLAVAPSEVIVTRPLLLRGVLLGVEPAGNQTIRLFVDGKGWGEATTDPRGYFSASRVAEPFLGVGAHEARARVAVQGEDVVSDAASFNMSPLPTRLILTLPEARLLPNVTVPLVARLVDEDGVPVPGRVTLALDGQPTGVLELDHLGVASFALQSASLALGLHEARATFAGDALHAPAEAFLAFEVAPPPPGRSMLVLWLLAALAFAVVALGGLWAARPRRRQAAPPDPLAAVDGHPSAPGPTALDAAATGDPLQDLLALHRALLARLAAEGVDVGPLTHREVAGALRARRYPEEPVRALTHALERALYAGKPPSAEEIPPMRAAFASPGAVA